MTTTEGIAAPIAGIDREDPVRLAEALRDEFRAGAAERDRDRKFPYEQCAAFRASGLLGLMVPREHGGYGGSFTELMKVVIAVSAGDSNIGQMYQLHTGGIRLLQEFAAPAVQARWLPRFTRELWITNAYSEVGTKSVNDFRTTVTRDGDGWRLNGRKFYCTGSLAGDITFGPCQVAGSDEVRVFFTPTTAEGVTIHDDWTGFGQRTNIVRFHDPTIGLLWLQWSVLWALFWLVLGLGVTRLTPLTGWLTLILSFTTCTIPGYLLLLGEWGRVPTWLVLLVIAATAAVLVPVGTRSLRRAPDTTQQPEAAVPVSVS